jgi:hypothetical protein
VDKPEAKAKPLAWQREKPRTQPQPMKEIHTPYEPHPKLIDLKNDL